MRILFCRSSRSLSWTQGLVSAKTSACQVRVFNVHIQSKLLQRTPVTGTGTGLRRFLCPGQEKREEGIGGWGTACTGGYKEVRAVRPESVADGG